MSEPIDAPITTEDRRHFVEGIVPLSLWVAHRFWREGMPLEEALTARTNIYRLTCLWDGERHPARPPDGWRDPSWEELLGRLKALYDKHDEDTTALEREGLEL